MPQSETKSGSELFIVDNSEADWKVQRYLREWCEIARKIDIATGYFEIGSLLALEPGWQKVDEIRILMGDEVTKRTRQALVDGVAAFESAVKKRLDESIEREKERNDFLVGVPAIVEALKSGKIRCKVYKKNKFHAKAYITTARQEVVGSFCLVGSSNFTFPGLSENIELNVQITGRQVLALQEWYERHWAEAEDVTADILKVIERHVQDYPPFDVYTKSLQEFFRSHEQTVSEWELAGQPDGSSVYPTLDEYQKEAYQSLVEIARKYGGAFLCDGVGSGKTNVGLMLVERLAVHERRRVAIFAPKSALDSVWTPAFRRYLPTLHGAYSNVMLFSHTDLGRQGEFPETLARVRDMADAIVIDEAHHFRNPGIKGITGSTPSRYRQLFDLIESPRGQKQLFLITATPVNNKLDDFRHMAELFTREDDKYFSSRLGIHSLTGYFRRAENSLKKMLAGGSEATGDWRETNLAEAEKFLSTDELFKALVVQRSRAYIKRSQQQRGEGVAIFPVRDRPEVVAYSIKKTYGKLLDIIDEAFKRDRPLFILGIYYPLFYFKGTGVDALAENRQKEVVGLIRIQFLKRIESSTHAFERSCVRLLVKLLAWTERHSEENTEKERLDRWNRRHADLLEWVAQQARIAAGDDEDAEDDLVPDELVEAVESLDRDEYRVEDMLTDTFEDLEQLVVFLTELRRFDVKSDDKVNSLVRLITTDPVLKSHKVLIFTEFADTARHLRTVLDGSGIEGVAEVDSGARVNRADVIARFAPYYNGTSSDGLAAKGLSEIRVLISTDVLSEGLNLQDATRLINYDIHWNPVRLMQRIGRVDRRMNPNIEVQFVKDHPAEKPLRGKVKYWNFLPPEELEILLGLYRRVSHKTLRISKTFGIEGRKLLKPDDDYSALREFNQDYEGRTTPIEELHLEYQKLLADNPGLEQRLVGLPKRVFSGKQHPSPGTKAVFFCYRIPRPDQTVRDAAGDAEWTDAAGDTRWYVWDIATEKIHDDPAAIAALIRSGPETERRLDVDRRTLADTRKSVERHINNTVLKKLQAPVGVKAELKAWMELN